MKKRKELDVDFIGGQGPLTKDEEKAISAFIRLQKTKKNPTSKKVSTRKKVTT
jgi:hypothetical protein